MYAGQKKIYKDIEAKLKAEEGKSDESEQKAKAKKKAQYYIGIMKKNGR